jgi:hypothetical protein
LFAHASAGRREAEHDLERTPEPGVSRRAGGRQCGNAYIQAAGTLFTHNHPGNSTFSQLDVMQALQIGVAEVRAVGPTLRHILTPALGWPSRPALVAELERAARAAQMDVERMIAAGELEPRFAGVELQHPQWVRVSRKFGLGYTREKS